MIMMGTCSVTGSRSRRGRTARWAPAARRPGPRPGRAAVRPRGRRPATCVPGRSVNASLPIRNRRTRCPQPRTTEARALVTPGPDVGLSVPAHAWRSATGVASRQGAVPANSSSNRGATSSRIWLLGALWGDLPPLPCLSGAGVRRVRSGLRDRAARPRGRSEYANTGISDVDFDVASDQVNTNVVGSHGLRCCSSTRGDHLSKARLSRPTVRASIHRSPKSVPRTVPAASVLRDLCGTARPKLVRSRDKQ